VERHKGWLRNLASGFLMEMAIYALKYLAFYEPGKFE
jgi:hypothetical protein